MIVKRARTKFELFYEGDGRPPIAQQLTAFFKNPKYVYVDVKFNVDERNRKVALLIYRDWNDELISE